MTSSTLARKIGRLRRTGHRHPLRDDQQGVCDRGPCPVGSPVRGTGDPRDRPDRGGRNRQDQTGGYAGPVLGQRGRLRPEPVVGGRGRRDRRDRRALRQGGRGTVAVLHTTGLTAGAPRGWLRCRATSRRRCCRLPVPRRSRCGSGDRGHGTPWSATFARPARASQTPRRSGSP